MAVVGAVAAWAVVRGDLPRDPARLATAAGLAFIAHLGPQLLGMLLCWLRLETVELGIGQKLCRPSLPDALVIRRLPVRLRLEWVPLGSLRWGRFRMALPSVLPLRRAGYALCGQTPPYRRRAPVEGAGSR